MNQTQNDNGQQPVATQAQGSAQTGGANSGLFPEADQIDLATLKTPTGKGITDFRVPEILQKNDKPLIDLVMRSESMKDSERQYWFNLTEVMNDEQMDKLRDILTRERQKLADIEAKYAKPKIDPQVAAQQAAELAQKRANRQAELQAKEAKFQAAEDAAEEDILGELDNL